jgi:hypothetical protein
MYFASNALLSIIAPLPYLQLSKRTRPLAIMAIGSLGWSSFITGLGMITLACTGVAFAGWVLMLLTNSPLKGLR